MNKRNGDVAVGQALNIIYYCILHVSGSQQQESKTEMLQKLQQLIETVDAMKKDANKTRKEARERDEQIRSKVNKVRIQLVGVCLTVTSYLNGNK